MTQPRGRKSDSLPRRTPEPAARGQGKDAWTGRVAAHLRAYEHRLALIDESYGDDEPSAPLIELDSLRGRLEELAESCELLRPDGAETADVEQAMKRLGWAVQGLEACRDLDDQFIVHLAEVRGRMEAVAEALHLGGGPDR